MHDVTHPCLTHDSSLHDWILSHPTSHGCQTNLHGCHIPVLTAWMAMDKHARVSTDAVATRCKIILTISVSQSQLLFLPYRCITVQLHRQGTVSPTNILPEKASEPVTKKKPSTDFPSKENQGLLGFALLSVQLTLKIVIRQPADRE